MRVLATSFMRLNSERVPQKLLAKVGKSSLAEAMVVKLLELRERFAGAVEVAVAVCPTDRPLVELAERLGCPVLPRSERSRDGETLEAIYGDLREQLQALHNQRLVVINPCQPFLRVETMAAYLVGELADSPPLEHPRTAVLRHRGWVWNEDLRLIHGDAMPNTKRSPAFHTLSHAFFSYPIGVLGKSAQMDFRHFFTLEPGPELIDIDTPADLEFARSYARGLESTAVPASEATTP